MSEATAPTSTGSASLRPVGKPPAHVKAGARRLVPNLPPVDHPLATARYQSPLRYPGAKSQLTPVIRRLVESAKTSKAVQHIDLLVEPFAGGASVSLRLVGAGVVDRVLLADADPLVAAFWQVAADDTEHLVDRMWDEYRRFVARGGSRAVARWDHWRAWAPRAGSSSSSVRRDTAVKALFLNRTTFSGILHGRAGPIGGRSQSSSYGIGARFNPQGLEERLRFVQHLYETGRLLDVWCKDWKDTLSDVSEQYPQLLPSRVMAYVDPPYLEKSQKLYQRSFDPDGGYARAPVADLYWGEEFGHLRLAQYLQTQAQFRWILSYDPHPSLTSDPRFYASNRMTPSKCDREVLGVKTWRISKRIVSLRYSASAKNGRGGKDELLMTTLPAATVPCDGQIRALL